MADITALTSEGAQVRTTEDLVNEYPEGQESELLPAEELEDVEPYEGATPVPIGGEGEG